MLHFAREDGSAILKNLGRQQRGSNGSQQHEEAERSRAVAGLGEVTIFNDFTNPLYYLPGKENVTVQLTLYNFQSMFDTQ